MKAMIAVLALVMTSSAFSAVTVGKVDVQKVLITVNPNYHPSILLAEYGLKVF